MGGDGDPEGVERRAATLHRTNAFFRNAPQCLKLSRPKQQIRSEIRLHSEFPGFLSKCICDANGDRITVVTEMALSRYKDSIFFLSLCSSKNKSLQK